MNKAVRKPLSELADIIMGQSPDSESYNNKGDGIPFYQGKSDFGVVHPTVRMYCNAPKKIAIANDILMSVRAPIGDVNIAQDNCCIGRGLAAIRPKEHTNLKYLFYVLDYYKERLAEQGTGSTFKAIGKDILNEFSIPAWDSQTQQSIANTIDEIQELIFNRQKALSVLDELVKSRFIEMFGTYITDSSRHKKLKDVCNFIDYRGKTPEKSDSGIPLITAKNVRDNHFSPDPQEFIPIENYETVMTRGIPKVNDVLFTTEAPLGNVCRIPDLYDKFCVGQRIVTIQPHPDILIPEYLERTLLSDDFQEKIWQQATGSTVKGIRSKRLIELTIPIPPLGMQKKYADFVTLTDKSKFAVQQSIDTLQTLKAKLMQDYFG